MWSLRLEDVPYVPPPCTERLPSHCLDEARRASSQTPNPEEQADTARSQAPQAQRDYADVPQWSSVVPERKVEAMQAVVHPAFDAVEAVDTCDHLAHLGIDIHPRSIGIAELHPKDGQRCLPAA